MALFIVATPIGNRADMTQRAVSTLQNVAIIYAEDTRHSKPLLTHFNIYTPLRSFHEHSKQERIDEIVERSLSEHVALISDAGTPTISDPGYKVIRAVHKAKGRVIPIPGPSAIITFISAAGLPSDSFSFVGFAPRKTLARRSQIKKWLSSETTTILYESPHRIRSLLKEIQILDPNREIAVGRELTKKFEEILLDSANNIAENFAERTSIKGEFVVGIRGKISEQNPSELDDWIQALAATTLPSKQIASIIAQQFKVKKKDVYQAVLLYRK